jgi:hypothetical protein
MEKQTNEQIQAKADELTGQLGVQVHPMVFLDPDTNEQIIGFIQEPNRITKLRVMDKGMTEPITAAAECLEAILIKDASDPRIWSEKPEHDKIYMGAVMAAYETIKVSVNQFKKK